MLGPVGFLPPFQAIGCQAGRLPAYQANAQIRGTKPGGFATTDRTAADHDAETVAQIKE